jgi:hypothetical protein
MNATFPLTRHALIRPVTFLESHAALYNQPSLEPGNLSLWVPMLIGIELYLPILKPFPLKFCVISLIDFWIAFLILFDDLIF